MYSVTLLRSVSKITDPFSSTLIVLPSTDLYLMGRHMTHSVMRGVTEAHKLLHHGVNCALSTNNVLNPFTPFGDCSLLRMANLYANIAQVGAAPPRFAVQVNDRKLISRDWAYYLENCLREAYELEGVPLVIDFVPKRQRRSSWV